VNYDDDTLMAFADGELDAAKRAEITAAMEKDAELARRIAHHRELRARVAGAFSPVLDQPVPDRLVNAARGATVPGATQRRGEVVQFPARGTRPPGLPWRGREWGAMAASVALGAIISWKLLSPADPLVTASNGSLVARGALASALDRQLASTQVEADPVRIGLSFESRDGHFCRSFQLRDAGTAGLGCRIDGEWRIPVTTEAATGDLRQASSPPPAVLQAIEARISGEALDPAGEEKARDAGWDTTPR